MMHECNLEYKDKHFSILGTFSKLFKKYFSTHEMDVTGQEQRQKDSTR